MHPANSSFPRTLTSGNFLIGLATGAVATFVLTNSALQSALFRTAARATNMAKVGFAEAKERYHDAEAEIEMEAGEDGEPTE